MGYKIAIERGVEKNNVQGERERERERIQYDVKNTRSGDRVIERAWQAIGVMKGESVLKRQKRRGRKREREREREGMDLLSGLSIGMVPTTKSQNIKEGTTGIINYCSMYVQYVQLFIVTATIT